MVEAALPKVRIYATGGTIAGASNSNSSTDTTQYSAGQVTVEQLLQAVPPLKDIAMVESEQFTNTGSNQLNTSILLSLTKKIQGDLDSDPDLSGVVVTMGTDTLEEAAFLFDSIIDDERPIVVTGAMRPTTSLSADGSFNLLQAVSASISSSSRNRGTLIVLNDRIGSAYYTFKSNTRTLDTFQALEAGFLGTFAGIEPIYYYQPARATGRQLYPVSSLPAKNTLPSVSILYAALDQGPGLLDFAASQGVQGVVIAGEGDGEADRTWLDSMTKLMSRGVPVITASRSPSGTVQAGNNFGNGTTSIPSRTLNPQKAKILLQLQLAKDPLDMQAVKDVFKTA
ncbi:Asparaginase [Ceraceosorus bombacis]|uniref:asparaginase n=1 Tax=Ceraceosorus bombacis TaxID=401625 RepID=A0A0P1BA58_9BASI|nr:Asparaginase [Ceraceosorus bombacis]